MKRTRHCIALAALAALACAAPARAEDSPPSPERAKTLFKDGNYRDCLAETKALLDLKGPDADKLDRHAIDMLRGEANLRIPDAVGSAVAAFAQARKDAKAQDQTDLALATETLARRCPTLVYRPKADASKAIDILTPDGRKEAFAALYGDEQDSANKKYDAAKTATDLGPIIDFAKALVTLHALEFAATGKTEKCDEMATAIRTKLFPVLDDSMKADEDKVATIIANAAKVVTTTVNVQDPATGKLVPKQQSKMAGPTPAEKASLQTMKSDSEKLKATLDEISPSLSITADSLKTRLTRNDAILKSVNSVLNADYSKPVANTPPQPPRRGGGTGGAGGGTGGAGGTGGGRRGGGTGGTGGTTPPPTPAVP